VGVQSTIRYRQEGNKMFETISISLCIAISGGVIGYIFGYRHGSGDIDRAYKDIYNIKDHS